MNNQKTLQQLFNEYIKECEYSARLSKQTIKNYREVFTLLLSVMPEITSVEFLTTQMISEFFKRLQTRERVVGKGNIKQGIQDSTVLTYRRKLNPFFEILTHKGYIKKNPFYAIKAPQLEYTEMKHLTDEQVRKIYASIVLNSKTTFNLRRDTLMISLLLFCGLRFGEFKGLEIRDVDFENHLLKVRRETSKSRKVRYIPIHPTLRIHLLDYITERNKRKYKSQYLITSSNSDTGLSAHGIKQWVKTLIRKSSVKFHIHQFRHTFASKLASNNVGAPKIQKLLGHSSLNMTMIYLRAIDSKDLKEDIATLSI